MLTNSFGSIKNKETNMFYRKNKIPKECYLMVIYKIIVNVWVFFHIKTHNKDYCKNNYTNVKI